MEDKIEINTDVNCDDPSSNIDIELNFIRLRIYKHPSAEACVKEKSKSNQRENVHIIVSDSKRVNVFERVPGMTVNESNVTWSYCDNGR